MRSTFLRAAVLVLAAILVVSCGSQNPISKVPTLSCVVSSQPAFAYVLNGFNTDTVSMFTVNSCTGALTPAMPATVPTGFNPESMVVDPLGRFVYVANLVSNAADEATISMYTINSSNGVLTPTNPPTVHTGFLPQGIAIDPSGKFVYTANSDDNSISMFTINQTTGILTPTIPASVPAGWSPLSITVDPSGRFAYAANQDDDTVSMYSINATTGVLTPLSPATVPTGGSPFDVALDPSGKFAYVPNAYDPNNTVSQYSVDSATGVLTPSAPNAIAGNQPTSVAVDSSGKFAYVVNRLDDTVSMFAINASNGNLTLKGTVSTGLQPFRIQVDPSGKFAYVANENGGSVSIYTLNADGTLTLTGSTATQGSALSVVLTKNNQ